MFYRNGTSKALTLSACAVLIMGCGGTPVQPSSVPFVFGETRVIRSQVLDEDRTLNVYLPEGYSPDSAYRYPVIFLLDGSANEDFPHIAGLVQFMNMSALFPNSIVVGIGNTGRSRYRDFTHQTRGDSDLVWVPEGGGSAAFIRFLAEELQPFIDANYLTDGSRTLVGQSLGGLLGVEILFKRPELFDQYVLVSPSLWWDNGSLAADAPDWALHHGRMPKRVFIAMARDDDWMRPQAEALADAFSAHARPPFHWTHRPFPDESHATLLHRGVYEAFLWLGAGTAAASVYGDTSASGTE